MKTINLQIDDQVARVLKEIAAERGVDETALGVEVLARFARLETRRRQWQTGSASEDTTAFAEEDRQLAEAGLEDYAKGLAAEDEA